MIKKIHYLFDYFKFIKNPISCLIFKFGLKKEVYAEFKNSNKKIKINNVKLLDILMTYIPNMEVENIDDFIQFNYDLFSSKKVVSWGGINIPNILSDGFDYDKLIPFNEFYIEGHYNDTNINWENRTVIDIGSFIGDTGLFFASQGAEVYGFEPVTKNYNYSLKLRELNPKLKDKLHFFNFGVSDKRGKLTIDSMDSTNGFRDYSDSYDIDIITIEDILKNNDIKPDILKMDCEGCEFNIILNTDLSNFKDIIFEHHSLQANNDYNVLINKLESQGFKTTKLSDPNGIFEIRGVIHAYK